MSKEHIIYHYIHIKYLWGSSVTYIKLEKSRNTLNIYYDLKLTSSKFLLLKK